MVGNGTEEGIQFVLCQNHPTAQMVADLRFGVGGNVQGMGQRLPGSHPGAFGGGFRKKKGLREFVPLV